MNHISKGHAIKETLRVTHDPCILVDGCFYRWTFAG